MLLHDPLLWSARSALKCTSRRLETSTIAPELSPPPYFGAVNTVIKFPSSERRTPLDTHSCARTIMEMLFRVQKFLTVSGPNIVPVPRVELNPGP